MSEPTIYVQKGVTNPDGSIDVTAIFWLTAPSNAVSPNESFQSVAPGVIGQTTLRACMAGTMVEQTYTLGAQPAGWTDAGIEALLVTAYNAAQTALGATNPATAGLVGAGVIGGSWTPLTTTDFYLNPAPTVAVGLAVSLGLQPGATAGKATGYVSTSAQTSVVVAATPVTQPGTNGQRSIVSTSANDAWPSGTGAQQVTVYYLDQNLDSIASEVVNLNGTTPVNLVNTTTAFAELMVVTKVGTLGYNNGTVNLMTGLAGAGSVIMSIAQHAGVGDNTTNVCQHYVAAGRTCVVRSMSSGDGVDAEVFYLTAVNPLVAGTPLVPITEVVNHEAGDNKKFMFPDGLAVVGPALIQLCIRPLASTADTAYGGFRWFES